jgi:hypothetical protein
MPKRIELLPLNHFTDFIYDIPTFKIRIDIFSRTSGLLTMVPMSGNVFHSALGKITTVSLVVNLLSQQTINLKNDF